MSGKGGQRFRRWLIDRIKETRYAVYTDGDTVERLAKRMGVTAAVLRAAQAEKAAELLEQGLNRRRRDVQLLIWCPPVAYEDIADRARRMQLSPGELGRAVAQTLLSGPDNPVTLYRYWLYQGQRYPPCSPASRALRISLSAGAVTALNRRAQCLSTTGTTLLRSAIQDYLNDAMTGVYVVPVTEMPDNPDSYWTGELTRKGEYRGHAGTVDP